MVRRVDLMSGQVLNTSLVVEKFFRVMFARFFRSLSSFLFSPLQCQISVALEQTHWPNSSICSDFWDARGERNRVRRRRRSLLKSERNGDVYLC